MRRLVRILLSFLVVGIVMNGVLAGCRGWSSDRRLVEADTLIAHGDFDSALTQLRTIDTASLSTDNRAYHALLMVHAAYKAYADSICLDTTWIARARAAYADGGPYDRHIRTLLYSGCVADELRDPIQAMRWFKLTELEAKNDDHYHRGYARMSMGENYRMLNIHSDTAISKYSEALREFQVYEPDGKYSLWCLFNLGQLYRLTNCDSALHYLNRTLSVAQATGDTTMVYKVHEALVGLYDLKKDYKKVKHHALKVVNEGMSPDVHTCYSYAALAYLHEGLTDSAKWMLTTCPPPPTIRDSVLHCRAMAEVENSLGHHNAYVALSDSAAELSAKTLMRNAQIDIIAQETTVKKDYLAKQKNRHYYTVVIIGIILFILLIALVYYYRDKFALTSKSLDDERSEKKELELALEQLKRKLEETQIQPDHNQPVDDKLSIFQANVNNILKATIFIGKYKKSIYSLDEVKDYDISLGDKEWGEIERYPEVAYPCAMKTLKDIQPPLTQNERRIVALECMEIPNAVQAKLLGYTPRSCITARQRIAEKLGASGMSIKQTIEHIEGTGVAPNGR